MAAELDGDGQPLEQALGWKRLRDSRTDELIGLCRGVLADGILTFDEARFVQDWLVHNPTVRLSPIGRELEPALASALSGGTMSPEDEEGLVTLMLRAIGGTPQTTQDASLSTSIPLDDPVPDIVFQ